MAVCVGRPDVPAGYCEDGAKNRRPGGGRRARWQRCQRRV